MKKPTTYHNVIVMLAKSENIEEAGRSLGLSDKNRRDLLKWLETNGIQRMPFLHGRTWLCYSIRGESLSTQKLITLYNYLNI